MNLNLYFQKTAIMNNVYHFTIYEVFIDYLI